MAQYTFPAILEPEDKFYNVSFPDIPHCHTAGEGLSDALYMAQDALCLMLYNMEERGEKIPASSDIRDVAAGYHGDGFVSLIACDTTEYRQYFNNKAVKKTLTIPAWLNTMAERQGINFSQTLQEALKEKVGA